MTLHAEEEMDEDGLSLFDVENALLTGSVVQRQTDRKSRERKYVIEGRAADDAGAVTVVVKFGPIGTLVILTVYGESLQN
jgi:hypothetical protein